jgi:hypothetical protein
MKSKLMLVGFGITLAVLFCFGSGESSAPQPTSADGRYRMFAPQQTSGATDVYVIDTQTGRIWMQRFYTDIKGFYFVPQPYLSADGQTASAVPPASVPLESLTLQNKYERELDQARQKKSEKTEK